MKHALNDKLRELRQARDNVVHQTKATRLALEDLAVRKDILQGKLKRETEKEKDLQKQLQEQQDAFNIAQGILDFVSEVVAQDRQNEAQAKEDPTPETSENEAPSPEAES